MSKDPEGWAFDFGCILHDNFNSDAVARIVVPFSAHGFRFAGTARPKTGFGMELLERLLFGSDSLWGGGVAHSVMILALVIALGIMLGKVKVAGVSLGVTGILFVGIAFSYFGMNIDEHLMHFLKEFGLILFVYSIGLQVGPGFFSSFRKGGITLNKLAVLVVALGVVTTVALYYVTGLPMTTMVGVMSGAVTNTPGLGAAQQAFSDLHAGADAPDIATGYALAYPLGVIGAILTLLALRYLLRIDVRQEEEAAGLGTDVLKDLTTRRISVEICNPAVEGKSISGIRRLALRDFVVSRICRPGEAPELADAATTLRCGDRILLVAAPKDAEALVALLGREVDAGPMMPDRKMISRRILITKPELNGKTLAELRIRSTSGVTITRINRSGIDLVAAGNLQLQLGDRVTVVGPELSVAHAERLFGNSLKRLNHPNLIPIFIGIALGVVLGSISFWIPGVPQPVKLGLAGGPLIVADRPLRSVLPAHHLYDDVGQPDAARSGHFAFPCGRGAGCRRGFRAYARRGRICLDRLRSCNHDRSAAAGGAFRTFLLQTQLLYADRRAFGRVDQSAGTGLFDRADHVRRTFGGICYGLSAVDVPAGAGGPAFDFDFRITQKGAAKQRPVTAITSHCIEISSRLRLFLIE